MSDILYIISLKSVRQPWKVSITRDVFLNRLCASWKLSTTIEGAAAERDHAHIQEKSLNELTAVLYIEAAIVAAIAEMIFIEIDMYVHHTVNRDM